MILRLVKMTFKPEETANFLAYFETIKNQIEDSQGLVALKLYVDVSNPNIFFTHSICLNTSCLDDYRKSDLFGKVWPKTKVLFQEPAMAWSLKLK